MAESAPAAGSKNADTGVGITGIADKMAKKPTAVITERKYFFIMEVYHHVSAPCCIESNQVSVLKQIPMRT